MKVFLVLVSLFAAVCALPFKEKLISGENGWYIPQRDGSFEWMNLKDAEELLANGEREEGRINTNPVSFYLYTKSNPISGQEINATSSSIDGSHFNKKHGTRFVIHGWTQSYKEPIYAEVTKAWLSKGDYNIIIVDWARARSLDYLSSVLAVPGAGVKVGEMIKYLHDNHGMSLDSLEIIGHSLGAHVAGFAGKTVGDRKVRTIVGLDPALPFFSYNKPDRRLSKGDAYYVESIHTNGGWLGFLKPIGKGAFYPNGGKKQPGCGLDLKGACAHGRSVTYYAEAVTKDDFGTMRCSDYKKAVSMECESTFSNVRMGAVTNAKMVVGDFYVPINSEAPFGKID